MDTWAEEIARERARRADEVLRWSWAKREFRARHEYKALRWSCGELVRAGERYSEHVNRCGACTRHRPAR